MSNPPSTPQRLVLPNSLPFPHTLLISSARPHWTVHKSAFWGILDKRHQMCFSWIRYGQRCEGLASVFFTPSPKRLHVWESNMAGVWPDKKPIQSSSFYKQTLHRFSRKKANIQSCKFFGGDFKGRKAHLHTLYQRQTPCDVQLKWFATGLPLHFFLQTIHRFHELHVLLWLFYLQCHSRLVLALKKHEHASNSE